VVRGDTNAEELQHDPELLRMASEEAV